MNRLSERSDSLWLLTAGPAIWAGHFLLCYLTAAIWCAKVGGIDGPLGTIRAAVAFYTVLALVGIAIAGFRGYRQHRFGAARTHDAGTAADRHRFIGFATLLLAGLSAVATLYVALPVVFIGSCR